MKTSFKLAGTILAIASLSLSANAAPRTFTDVTGRKIEAELVSATATSVTLKLQNGKTAELEMAKLSWLDQSFVEKWSADQAKDEKSKSDAAAAAERAIEIPKKIIAFCKDNMGKQVGNGECWTLADEAFKASGLKRPTADLRVWGRLVDYKKEPLQAGDIVEYRNAAFADGSHTGAEHTAIIVKVERRNTATIAQQNWSGHKTVAEAGFNPKDLKSGEIMVYRPE